VKQAWLNKAALYETLALAFLLVKEELIQALIEGEYAEAVGEIAQANGFADAIVVQVTESLAPYRGRTPDEVLHELRQEYTRLFVGSPQAVASPFAGIWYAESVGTAPLLFVNKESMAVERFMRSCGVGQPQGTNQPLDHISSELEFLQYLCLLRSGVAELPLDLELPDRAYEEFYRKHFIGFAEQFATVTIQESRAPFYTAMAQILAALPGEPE
jgi:TorA maturation chaperone TorD